MYDMSFCVGFCHHLIYLFFLPKRGLLLIWTWRRIKQYNFFFFSSTRCQCGVKSHNWAPMRLENAQCKATFIFTLSRFNKSAPSIEYSVELVIDEAWGREGLHLVMDSAASRSLKPVFVQLPSGFHCRRSLIHLNERYSRRCHNSQAAHAGWRLLGSADSTLLWLLSSFPSWVWAYLLSNSKTNHSQFLLELFILVLFIPENSHFWLVCKLVMKAGTLAFKDKASVDHCCSKQSESITERDLTRNNVLPSKCLYLRWLMI